MKITRVEARHVRLNQVREIADGTHSGVHIVQPDLGRLHLGNAAGLGVELNEDVLAQFAVTD